jgi:hypothetical protein
MANIRTKTIAIRLSPTAYEHLLEVCDGYDIPPSTYAYLAVMRALNWNRDLLVGEPTPPEDLMP